MNDNTLDTPKAEKVAGRRPPQTEAAMARRLLALLRGRYLRSGLHRDWIVQLETQTDGWKPEESYDVISLCAAIVIVKPQFHGTTWEQMKQAFQTGRGDTLTCRALNKTGRAMRLVDHLVLAGCRKRGEL